MQRAYNIWESGECTIYVRPRSTHRKDAMQSRPINLQKEVKVWVSRTGFMSFQDDGAVRTQTHIIWTIAVTSKTIVYIQKM